jgi:hypothetical protein
MKRIALVLAAGLIAVLFGPAAQAATDKTGPTIKMQTTGHLLTHAAVQGLPGDFTDGNQVFETLVDVRWSGSDPSGICDYQVWNDSGRDVPSLMADVGKQTHYQILSGDLDQSNGGYNYTNIEIRAIDCAGNATISGTNCTDPSCDYPTYWPFPPTDRSMNLPDNVNYVYSHDDNAATYAGGGWTHSNCNCFMGGTDIHSGKAGASMTFVADSGYAGHPGGSTFGLVSEYGPGRGAFKVYQDGVYKATVNLNAAANTGAQVVWSAFFQTAGTHTYKIVVVGTPGHPRVDVDGFFTGPTACDGSPGLCIW